MKVEEGNIRGMNGTSKENGQQERSVSEKKEQNFMYEYHNKIQFCMLAKMLNKDISLNFDSKFYYILTAYFQQSRMLLVIKHFIL